MRGIVAAEVLDECRNLTLKLDVERFNHIEPTVARLSGDNPIYPNFNANPPIFFCPSCSYVLKICAWVLQIFFGRRIRGLYAVTLEGGGVVMEGAV